MRFFTATIISALAALAMGHTQPDYSKQPKGNAIVKPGLHEQVPEGKPYTIHWEPSTEGPISLVLLHGPTENVKPLETIAEKIPNSGKYEWTPSTKLTPEDTHYGLLLVVEGSGQYQYSTQFGLTNKEGSGSSNGDGKTTTVVDDVTTTICPESQSATATPTSTPSSTVTVIDDVTTTICPESQSASATATPSAPVSAAPSAGPSVPSSPAGSAPVTPSAAPSAAPSVVPSVGSSSTVTQSLEVTTTICPEESKTPAVTPGAGPSAPGAGPSAPAAGPFRPASSVPFVPGRGPSTLRSSPASAPTQGAASPSASSYSGAGRNAVSLGAVVAAILAVVAV
ncbi:hypothetical protein NUU61_009224 [Penicillium alfredii]|uniref:Yeast cell wall synthesis Kre9/Knh1-like N-terminal domain-containing protein n=1 Tax=Penicillium alfredii TaxID=1506179 RepID=A0A9W9JX22_9EURO|nr:uncharacterized protein NUU61_009224 [Penicillium alfredii]KAJ5084645.1 hypothetical protein NUU61_009224 [Penicillium alfredii]